MGRYKANSNIIIADSANFIAAGTEFSVFMICNDIIRTDLGDVYRSELLRGATHVYGI